MPNGEAHSCSGWRYAIWVCKAFYIEFLRSYCVQPDFDISVTKYDLNS